MTQNSNNFKNTDKNIEDKGTEWIAGAIMFTALLFWAGFNPISAIFNIASSILGSIAIYYSVPVAIGLGLFFAPKLTLSIVEEVFSFCWKTTKYLITNSLYSNNDYTIKASGELADDSES